MVSPIILLPACTMEIGAAICHSVQEKYLQAVVTGAGGTPLILPALAGLTDWQTVLAVADGIMLTGSPSNVHPDHFRQTVLNEALPLDPARDATTLPLIRAAVQRGIPLFAICRGAQEINVALGGSLHQAVQAVPGMMDRSPRRRYRAIRAAVRPGPPGDGGVRRHVGAHSRWRHRDCRQLAAWPGHRPLGTRSDDRSASR